eukprot:TRINITY_DN40249_c0_g1_i1.p1 TRINITY_DN40249_c0_g1~~TRINITY_DN40249_c0_g1_i1.p1  ORF type:complete len:501 (+),score=110.24 TRINITY_DN40249_c0_g1_i1:65-1567(+)
MAGVHIMSASAMKERFRMLDKDLDGELDFDEMYAFLCEGREMSKQEARMIFDRVDKDRSGKVDFDEFVDYLHASLRGESVAYAQGSPAWQRRKAGSLPNLLQRSAGSRDAGSGKVKGSMPTPGPGAYDNALKEHVPGGSYFGTGHILVGTEKSVSMAQEKKSFRKYDLNNDGTLDFQELCSLLRRGDPNVDDFEVQALFGAIDKNGDGRIVFTELTDYLHPAGGAFENSAWRKKLKDAFDLSCPGPADYAGSDTSLAHVRKAPKATIGKGPRHMDYGVNKFSPGPAAYQSNDKASCFYKKAASATIGNAFRYLEDQTPAPGPSCYDKDFSVLAHLKKGPRATIGNAKRQLQASSSQGPGPASYSTKVTNHVKGGNYFGVPGRMANPDLPHEKRQFNQCDANKDGTLSFEEVFTLLRRHDNDIKHASVKRIFESCDKNGDGKIQFRELMDFIHPMDANDNSGARRKFKELFAQTFPGPADYDIVKAKSTKIKGGAFGKAER